MDLVLFTLLLELVNLNINVNKGHKEFGGEPLMPYCTIYVTVLVHVME